MKAIAMHAHGGPEVLRLEERPDPEPGPGEVVVRVRAVGLNHLDIWVRQGWPSLKLRFPHVLGSDVAGVVDREAPRRDGDRDRGQRREVRAGAGSRRRPRRELRAAGLRPGCEAAHRQARGGRGVRARGEVHLGAVDPRARRGGTARHRRRHHRVRSPDGSAARLLPAALDPRIHHGIEGRALRRALRHVREGKLRPVLDRVLPLAEAAAAQKLLADRAQFGKIVLQP